MLAPMYQDAAFGNSVCLAISCTCSVQPAAAGSAASILSMPCSRGPRQAVADPLHVLLDRHRHVAEHRGLPGPVIVNRFGNPGTASPR